MRHNSEPTFEMVKVNGRLMWLSSDGDFFPAVRGGAGEDDNPPPAKTLTQDEVNAIIGETRRKAKEAATAELLKQLGADDVDGVKAVLKAAKDAEDATATELEKAKRKQAEAEAKVGDTDKTLAQVKLTTAIEKALIKEGVSVEAAERIRKLVEVDKLDEDDIKAAIVALRKDMPALFSEGATGGNPPSNPGTPPPKKGEAGDPDTTALRVLHERHPHLKPK